MAHFIKPSFVKTSLRSSVIYLSLFITLAISACSPDASNVTEQKDSQALEKTVLNYQSLSSLVSYPELAEDLGYLAPI
ncbi:MAG: hypothetical protein U1C59_01035, partial [Methylotenera sp.]|nr:hypothetical protein [Methylotenera sp.]